MGRYAAHFDSLLRAALLRADWLGADRARAYVRILGAISLIVALVYVGLSHGVLDPLGKALGTDFASFWTASHIALDGGSPWNVEAHSAAQVAMFGQGAGYAAFFYPPPYLLVCLPLALVPYTASLAIWLAATGFAWVKVVRAWLGREAGWLPILAFPAVLVNAGHGQNGFLTAALVGGAAMIAQRRPWLSGVLFGCLIVKPHLALLVPLFMIVTGNWRGFIAAGATAAGICVISLLVLGTDSWRGFFETSALARATLEHDLVGYAKMQSAYAGARLMGADGTLAWAVQGMAMIAAGAALWLTRKGSEAARGAVLACATLAATPFLLDYDLTLLAVPLAWLFAQGLRGGFRSGEKLILLAGFVLPMVSRTLGMGLAIPIAPVVILALLAVVARRALATQAVRQATGDTVAPAPLYSIPSMARS